MKSTKEEDEDGFCQLLSAAISFEKFIVTSVRGRISGA